MKQWVLRENVEGPDLTDQPAGLAGELLFNRGIKTKEEAERFLNPDYERDLDDPFKILNMDRAVERILRAIQEKERIIIFGDYDADGVCSCAIFYDFFKKIDFQNFHIHIPDRHLDGYGLTLETIDEFTKDGSKLIMTLDCGINDYEEVEKANKAGIDVVIIDHHLVPVSDGLEKVPNAYSVVDLKQKNETYAFKDFCGAGLAFKTIQALIKRGNEENVFNVVDGWNKWLLDLAGTATIADMMPLKGENRVLVFYGLQVLKKMRRQGWRALSGTTGVSLATISEDDISFMFAPRINIASRMDHANISFNLLTTESGEEADWEAGRLEALSVERKRIVEIILSEIKNKITAQGESDGKIPDVIVAGDKEWNPGVLGLVATKLIELYDRPVFLWGRGSAKDLKGSCRSNGSVNVVELMKEVTEGVMDGAGGHPMAGGFSMSEDKADIIEAEILKAFEKIPKNKTENDILHIDKESLIDDIDEKFWAVIEKFQPFGVDNPKPIFLFKNIEICGVRKFGNGGIHLQLDFRKTNREKVSAIGFFMNGAKFDELKVGRKIDLVATLEKSYYRATPELRLRIVDLKMV